MKNTEKSLFFQALRIRLVEQKIMKIYPSDKIQSPVHLSIGQEAIAVGVCNNLQVSDLLYSSYRCHAYYLAKGGNMNEMFAELYGKSTGCGKGKAGSMHLAAKDVGFMGSSAIVGGTIAHATGSALAAKLRKTGQICVATFGDGATEEGSYHESLNFAATFKLPVIFICENNGLAIHSKVEQRHSYLVHKHAASYGIKSIYIENGYDFEEINRVMKQVVTEVRETQLPYLIEIKTYRYLEHVGVGDDHNVPYRDENDLKIWQGKDPLIQNKSMIDTYSSVIQNEIEAAVAFAENSPFPEDAELFTDIY